MSLAQAPILPTMAEIHEITQTNAYLLELEKANMKIVGDVKEQAGIVYHLEGRNEATTKVLRQEAEWIEAARDILKPSITILPEALNSFCERNKRELEEMALQNKVILDLKRYFEGAVHEFEQHTTQILFQIHKQARMISHLESRSRKLESQVNDQKGVIFTLNIKKGAAEYERQEQTRIADSLDKRLMKMKEVINNQAQTMLGELDYQQELIDELDAHHEEYFRPLHNTMMDMVENIEHWTGEDSDDFCMAFKLETESHASHEIISELQKTVDNQGMKLKHREEKISEQQKIILDVKHINARLASELQAQTDRMACLLELQNIQKDQEKREKRATKKSKKQSNKKWHIEHMCNTLCKAEKESMQSAISSLHYRLRPLESNLLNTRQRQFCFYIQNCGTISAQEANAMLRTIDQSEMVINPAEADARMVQERLPQYAADFVRLYGVPAKKILESGE
jgi:hypothetical protein